MSADPVGASGRREREPGRLAGRWIVRAAWLSDLVFAAVTVPHALGADELGTAAAATSLALFLVSLPVWVYALLRAVVRSARGDDIAVASLFFLSGSAPRRVQVHLLGATATSIALAAAVAAANPTAVMVPMLTLGLTGLWGATYGKFPPRPAESSRGTRR